MNKKQVQLIISYALDEILSSCDDNQLFWEKLLKCDSHEDFHIICEDLNVVIWEPFEDENYEELISRVDDKISCFTHFIYAYQNLTK